MVNNIQSTDKLVFDLEMLQIDYNEEKIASLKREISNKYKVPLKNIELNFKPITVVDGDKVSLASEITNNVQNAEHQKDMMKHYLKLKGYDDIDWDDIDAIDNQVNSFIDFDQYSHYKNYKFKYVKWNNYLSYGEGNYFDFTKLHGLVLLNSEPANQGGKTTFAIDLLRFALFGKADKSPNLDSVFNSFNPEATTALVEAGIEIDGDDYVIRRTITRPALSKRTAKSKCKQQLEYFKKVGDSLELIENCEGENVQQTNNIIKDSVGDVEDFNLVISATSFSLGELLRMGQTDKGRLFSRWLGLLSIEKKEEVAKKLWKENYAKNLLSNTYNRETLSGEIEDYKVCIDGENEDISKANEILNVANDNIILYNNKKNDLLSKLKPISNDLGSVDLNTVESHINSYNLELQAKRGSFVNLKGEYAKVKDASFSQEDLDEAVGKRDSIQADINQLNIDNGSLKTEIGLIRKDNEHLDELLEKGVCPTCHQTIDVFENSKLKETNNNRIQELINNGVENKGKIESLTLNLNSIANEISKHEQSRADVQTKANLELRLTAMKANIENIKLKIKAEEDIRDKIHDNEENLKHNNAIMAEGRVIEESIKNETRIKETKIAEIEGHKKNIEMYDKEIAKRSELIDKIIEEEKVIRNWSVYQEIVGKNGIIKLVLKDALPIINNEVARILNGLCDFETILDIDDKNNVVINLVKDGVTVGTNMGVSGSGFEGTIASLALRSALASISTMSKPNFLVLDEVLGLTASCNYENIHELYKRIISNYDFIIDITHNENIYDWHDGGTITVVKVDNISKIK